MPIHLPTGNPVRHTAMLLVVLGLSAGAVPAEPPPPLELTEEEEATLASGEVVSRVDVEQIPASSVGVIDVSVPPERLWEAVFDFQARAEEQRSIKAADVYEGPAGQLAVRWTVGVAGVKTIFHTLYYPDLDQGWCPWELDDTKDNDLNSTVGSYQVYAVDGESRLVYRGRSDPGRRTPMWLRRWLATESMKNQLEGFKRRAEGG